MKVICAPDSYKESLSAVAVTNAMAAGIRQSIPGATIDCCPVGDGGEGTLAALMAAVVGETSTVEVSGPFGEDIDAEFGIFDNGIRAFVESAKCIGLNLIPPDRRNPTMTTSFGVGELILEAATTCHIVIVGIGGSATNDGGCGLAQALGYRFFDIDDNLIVEPLTGGMLLSIGRIDITQRSPVLPDVEIIVASDVNNPLTGTNGAAAVYAAQKGADASQVALLDEGLVHLAEIIRRDLQTDIEHLAGAGAAGGIGGGLVAFAGARIESGIDFVLDVVGFGERVTDCDLCLTGEGRLDSQSISGKACIGVARTASEHGVPAIALVGSVGDGAELCLDAGLDSYIEIGAGLPEEESIRRASELISIAAASVSGRSND